MNLSKSIDKSNFFVYYLNVANRCVAQLGRALRSGRRGRRFESCRIDTGKYRKHGTFLFP